jgi:hypothetical protein
VTSAEVRRAIRHDLRIRTGVPRFTIRVQEDRTVIAAVTPSFAPVWPTGWEDVEVVDSVLVEEPATGRRFAQPAVPAGCYDGSGRVALEGRFGRLVSVLA